MRNGIGADTFAMLMRTALPDVQANLTSYMQESPFYVLKIGAKFPLASAPAPIIGYASETSGIVESARLQTALNSLVADIKANYLNQYSFVSNKATYASKVGWDCILDNSQCAGDNHDALYSVDTPNPVIVKTLKDMVIVVG